MQRKNKIKARTISLRLHELAQRLDRAAKREKCSRNALFDRILRDWIDASGKLLLPEREEEPEAPGWREEVRLMIREELAQRVGRSAQPGPR